MFILHGHWVHQDQAPVAGWQCKEFTLCIRWTVPSSEAGRNCWRMVSSRGFISGDILSMVFRKYVQWPVRPCVNAERAAWGSALAIYERHSSSGFHATFSTMYFLINSGVSRAALRCCLPVHVMWIPVSARHSWPYGGVLPLLQTIIWSCLCGSQM